MVARHSSGVMQNESRVKRILSCRALPLWLGCLSALLTLPSLGVGLVADDLSQRLRFIGSPKLPEIAARPGDMFTFADGDPVQTRRLMDRGFWPWWTVDTILASFWRPLTVLTHRLDYWLWPNEPVLMHAHSIDWLAVLSAVVTVLYRRVMGVAGRRGWRRCSTPWTMRGECRSVSWPIAMQS